MRVAVVWAWILLSGSRFLTAQQLDVSPFGPLSELVTDLIEDDNKVQVCVCGELDFGEFSVDCFRGNHHHLRTPSHRGLPTSPIACCTNSNHHTTALMCPKVCASLGDA